MCVDYTDLNKHCPKDCYPLPIIDKKVEALVGYEIFYFLDLYKGYHQVLMSDKDTAKTTFITDFSVFAYQKMPFGLKNVGATYQRMVDKIFQEHIGRTVEVYVDDIVVKIREKSTCADYLRVILTPIRSINLKLNPQKYTFMVHSRKFLRCWISKEGLKSNSPKVQAVQDMQVPKSIHDVHRLTGCLAALSRFLSKAAERQLPFFKLLKKALEFEWGDEHELVFEGLKQYLTELPTLSVPAEGETLSLYLAASDEAVSAVLVRESEGRQLSIYFVSRALKGPETRYQPLEKGALALVNAARRLRHYFQAHSIRVLTDLPLRQVLTKPEASGRVVKESRFVNQFGYGCKSP